MISFGDDVDMARQFGVSTDQLPIAPWMESQDLQNGRKLYFIRVGMAVAMGERARRISILRDLSDLTWSQIGTCFGICGRWAMKQAKLWRESLHG